MVDGSVALLVLRPLHGACFEDRRKAFYLTVVGHYYMSYNREGEETGQAYSEGILSWEEEGVRAPKGRRQRQGRSLP